MNFLKAPVLLETRICRALLFRRYAGSVQFEPVILRPYQESCLQVCLKTLGEGVRRIGVSLPTGSGKTTVFVSLLAQIPPRGTQRANRGLIIVNSIELARQAASQVERLFPELSVEIEQGTKHKASGTADITVATYQTLLHAQRIAKFDPQFLKAVVVDEAHHAAAPSYRRILGHFDPSISTDITIPPSPQEQRLSIPIIGFSATFGRHDGLSLGSVFDKIVYHRDFLQMIKEHWPGSATFDLRDFNATSLAHVINTATMNKLVVQTWLDRASARKSTLVFCVNLAHVRDLTNQFRVAGLDARYLYSGTPISERKALLNAFKGGDFPVLINCAILTEGADIPNIDCVLVARPTRSRNVFAQMIGRGMRLSPQTGKEDCHIIDFVDSTNRVSGIISTPTLFGLDVEDEIDDETLASLEERAKQAGESSVGGFSTKSVPEPTSITYVDYENPFSLAYGASGSPHIATLSSHAWVACGGEIYVLECLGRGYIRIEPLPGNDTNTGQPAFHAHYTAASPGKEEGQPSTGQPRFNPYRRSRRILTAQNLSDAVQGCDTYAKDKVMFGTLLMGLFRSAKWRKSPASPSQKTFIAKRHGLKKDEENGTRDSREDSRFEHLTKGEAANIITRLKHGAQARYTNKIRESAKIARTIEKESRRRAREHVRIGPLSME